MRVASVTPTQVVLADIPEDLRLAALDVITEEDDGSAFDEILYTLYGPDSGADELPVLWQWLETINNQDGTILPTFRGKLLVLTRVK